MLSHAAIVLHLLMFLICEASTNSDCHGNVCLSSRVVKNELTLVCVVPNLCRQIVFSGPNNMEYAHCVLPFPKPHCYSQNYNNSIVQNLHTNQTMLIIPRSNNTALNGWWTCRHGNYKDRAIVKMEMTKGEVCSNCLEYKIIAILSGTIVIFLFAGIILTRHSTKIRDGTGGKCEICAPDLIKGCRICYDGLLRAINQMSKDMEGTVTENETHEECNDTHSLLSPRERKNIDYTTNYSRCQTCEKETYFSFCIDCKNFYCETCVATHINKLGSKKHSVMQTNQYPFEKHEKLCQVCKKKSPKLVCRLCRIVLCTKCSCQHTSDKDTFKQLLAPSSPIIPTTRSRNQKHSEILRKSYKVTVSDEKSITRIRGLAYLESGYFVLADYRNKQLKVFSRRTFLFDKNIDMEPRGMTGIWGGQIAVTFAYEKKIVFYDVNNSCATETKCFNFEHIGKPYDIAHHQNHFIVELNEGVDGCIIILDNEGDKKYQIQNDDWKFGYFTGNTIRLQLDMDKKEFYVAAIGKQAVYCLDFNGNVKWLVKVPSPRSIAIVPNTKDTTLLFASHKSSTIYKLICEEKKEKERYKPALIEMETVDENELEDKIELPKYISYDHKNRLLYTEVANGHVSVYHLETPRLKSFDGPFTESGHI